MAKRNIELLFLIGYLILFGALFLLALYDFSKGKTIVNLGFEPKTTSVMIMILSFAGIIKSIYHLYIFELKE